VAAYLQVFVGMSCWFLCVKQLVLLVAAQRIAQKRAVCYSNSLSVCPSV